MSIQAVDVQQELLSAGQVADMLGCPRRHVSDLLYQRRLPDGVSVLLGGRWLVRADSVELVAQELRKLGKLSTPEPVPV